VAYRLIADLTMVTHFAFLAFVVVGGFLAWRWPWIVWPHVVAVVWGFSTVLAGFDCPLTHLEDWGRVRAGQATLPATGFIDHYLAGVVYPQEFTQAIQALVFLAVVVSWVGIAHRRRRRQGGRRLASTSGPPSAR
jgi:hypothetical protein